MTRSDPTVAPGAEPLDYAKAERASTGWWRRARGDVGDRIDGVLVFLGQIIGLIGSVRQAIFAGGVATIAGGLGICLERGSDTTGPVWMWLGGFVVGALLPIPQRGKSNGSV